MLEVKNLVKSYSTKGGVSVRALDDVSVKFPETGMVFLLGKSGSGKSTLLNVSGGLDKPDSGEIIVKGRSSNDFTPADFDSYRNTYVGFVFQEYNILNEFTVEQNVALALQLQNKANDKKAVDDLLEKVDLKGYGKRKPNTLSGGQKQRVAIARALIKEPEIIMADEPTGALDSNTGKQVLDTLKKLSETKLVVVVSHDREFAEQYGDRIIELKDGKILSDVSKAQSEPKRLNENVLLVSDDTISIRNAENITESDVKDIVKMLKQNGGEAIITTGKRELPEVKRACKINDSGKREYFKQTETVSTKEYDGSKTKFIKSKLPASHAFKMGASGLKTKPIRLIFTILLSVIAFIMFGVVSTFMLYDPNYSISEALKTANYPNITISKYYAITRRTIEFNADTGEQKVTYENDGVFKALFGSQDIADKNASGDGDYAGIFNFTNDPETDYNPTFSVKLKNGGYSNSAMVKQELRYYYPVTSVCGFTDCGAEYMERNGFALIGQGRYPETVTEIAIPEYVANLFVDTDNNDINTATDMLGKVITITNSEPIMNVEFTVVGVYDVGNIPDKYDELKNSSVSDDKKIELSNSLSDYLKYSYNTILYVCEDFYEEYKPKTVNGSVDVEEHDIKDLLFQPTQIAYDVAGYISSVYSKSVVSFYSDNFKFYNLSGEPTTFSLADNQVYVLKRYYDLLQEKQLSYYALKIYDYRLFDDVAKIEINDEFADALTQLNIGTLEDKSIIENAVNKWYLKLAEKNYVFTAISRMINNGYQLEGLLYDKVLNFNNNTSITESEWNALKTEVEANYQTICPQGYLSDFLDEMYDRISEQEDYRVLDGYFLNGTFHQKLTEMETEGLSSADMSVMENILNEHYERLVGHAVSNGADRFAVAYPLNLQKIYYANSRNVKGSLDVVGYFTTDDSNGYTRYIVSDKVISQLSGRGTVDNVLINTIESEYVVPQDAKYNYLTSLTDNTQSQIANALNANGVVTYKSLSQVYAQLGFFLETISLMNKIFLVAGIVFGLFAALMLLNFISASISAKRKDIGILRAVGARGVDVFKIFFAEAFIIALICFVVANVGAYFVCGMLNNSLSGIVNMKLLNFNIVNAGLILVISFVVSVIATFFPVYLAAKKLPVESIRAL